MGQWGHFPIFKGHIQAPDDLFHVRMKRLLGAVVVDQAFQDIPWELVHPPC